MESVMEEISGIPRQEMPVIFPHGSDPSTRTQIWSTYVHASSYGTG
jgi:hypothetical protein